MKNFISGILVFTFLFVALPANASDVAKEKRWADQIVDSIFTGEPVWLLAGKHKFLGIYTESEGSVNGAIIIHGIGVHPNWADVVQPLRTQLPESGWQTLSLQMPILANEAKESDYKPLFPEIAPRIEAGIKYLKKKGVKNIVIIGHSMGATMAAYYMATKPKSPVTALVSIGAAGLSFKDSRLDFVHSLKKIKKPIDDISGSEDLPGVRETKSLKLKIAKESGKKNYRQVEVQGANHFFAGKEKELISTVTDILKARAR